jgi:hypothetical protein
MEGSQVELARQIVLATLSRLSTPQIDGAAVKETALLGDRNDPGRRFQFEKIRAIWFADSSAIEFFDDDGNLLETVDVERSVPNGQAAA